MESFLKYLRGGAVAGNQRAPVVATTIAASVCEDGGEVEDDASFFDLEFAVPGDESAASDAEEERVEINFDVASDAKLVTLDAAATDDTKKDNDGAEEEKDDIEPAPPPPASLLRPATRFRVLLLKLRKPKAAVPAAAKTNNRFLIKFRVDDAPQASLFTRDNSSRTSDAADRAPAAVQAAGQQPQGDAVTAEERRFAKEVLVKYLNKIRPLYVKVSRRYGGERRRGDGEETDAEPDTSSPAPSPQITPPSVTQPVVVACGVRAPRVGVPAGLKQACKRLGKSRSASAAVAAAPSAGSPASAPLPTNAPQRRDDSLLQLQDGIQSAIAHCKRSFNASKGSESPLLRSMTTGGDATRDGSNDGA